MRKALTEKEWVIGLYAYSPEQPSGATFEAFYETITDVFTQLGAAPTYIAAEGKGFTGRAVEFGGRVSKKLLNSGFEGISVLDISSTPEGSESPAYDRFAAASLSFNLPCETLLCFVLNEGFEPFEGDFFYQIVDKLLSLRDWSFGFAFADKIERQPDFHVLGVDSGKLEATEQAALNAWYMAPPEKKTTMLRGIYPVMFFNRTQLQLPGPGDRSLADYISVKANCTEVQSGSLLMCTIPPHEIDLLLVELAKSGALIM